MKIKVNFLIIMAYLFLSACSTSQTKDNGDFEVTAIRDSLKPTNVGLELTFVQGCRAELTTYCSNVTPGNGRELACIFAYEDKLSSVCVNTLYDSAQRLSNAVVVLTYLANECEADIDKYCSHVEPGTGGILACMKPFQKVLSQPCNKAIQDIGLER